MNSPTYLLSKTKIREEIPYLVKWLLQNDENEIKKQSCQIEKQIRELQSSLDAILKEFKDLLQSFISSKQQITEQITQVKSNYNQTIKFTQFQELIQQLEKNGEQKNQDIVKQIENQLFQYFISIKKEQIRQNLQTQAKQQQYDILLQSPKKLEEFNTQAKELNQKIIQLCSVSKIKFKSDYIQSKLLSEPFKAKLINQIEEGSKRIILKFQQVYLGSRDGLNASSFWAKVNGKSNLFFVFQSQKNYTIFGGYSPCQWANLGTYSQDDTVTSFLFSQTNNEIYPLKQDKKGQSIFGSFGYGPIFGNYDMLIQADFTQGQSNLGYAYKWDNSKGQYSSHLFGALQPNISECEIFEIIFS